MSGYLGIDWGTHSSKWAFQRRELNTLVGSIWDSAVCPAGTKPRDVYYGTSPPGCFP